MQCKKALAESDGDFQKATEYLRIKGLATASKKQGRDASEGVVAAYVHTGNRCAVLDGPVHPGSGSGCGCRLRAHRQQACPPGARPRSRWPPVWNRLSAGSMGNHAALRWLGASAAQPVPAPPAPAARCSALAVGRPSRSQQGTISTRVRRVGVIMEVNCETDFVARSDDFSELVELLCMQLTVFPDLKFISANQVRPRTMPFRGTREGGSSFDT